MTIFCHDAMLLMSSLGRITPRFHFSKCRRVLYLLCDIKVSGGGLADWQRMVESGNKPVVEARLKGVGMHWRRENLNPLLGLRNIVWNDR